MLKIPASQTKIFSTQTNTNVYLSLIIIICGLMRSHFASLDDTSNLESSCLPLLCLSSCITHKEFNGFGSELFGFWKTRRWFFSGRARGEQANKSLADHCFRLCAGQVQSDFEPTRSKSWQNQMQKEEDRSRQTRVWSAAVAIISFQHLSEQQRWANQPKGDKRDAKNSSAQVWAQADHSKVHLTEV